ncbi:hypothetical protein NNJEOMEG_03316 [Fundidesulfovibrio magnetotacticus]|uniref:Uncharacterized protein n=1 Tax=Fundidesulfovibrio magnetotacticus TaxID=2730080 RepID=A0A6V8LSJ8_9BACT|nr:hypothetical protein [Fundidesulfovibrio magnetotacticus]GFK95453.1 hypothetical protein NNJEOMEG_03316 [Fundidesulfovibrio magnetotacticus]
MTFTPLESSLMAIAASILVGVAVHILTRNAFVSHAQCQERRNGVCADIKALQDDHDKSREDQSRKTAVLFQMVRALIVHNKDMPADVKEQILNKTAGGGE